MAYTDKAPWETNPMTGVNAISSKPHVPFEKPAPKFWSGGTTSHSPTVSPILSDWIYESKRRANGEMNNLDWVDMKNALDGFINQYTPLLNKHRDEIKKFATNATPELWDEVILPLKAQYKLKK